MLQLLRTPSPNFDTRPTGVKPSYIVVHYTSMAGPREVIDCFQDPTSKLSAHYLIEQSGATHAMVEPEHRAWHAGRSRWRGQSRLNDNAIGIELDNRGHNRGYHEFPYQQLGALAKLCQSLQEWFHIAPEAVIGHSDISLGRKFDPGEKFCWRELAQDGVGVWPSEQPVAPLPRGMRDAQLMLQRIGYDVPVNGIWDEPTVLAIKAFQMHYAPEDLRIGEQLPLLTRQRLAGMPQLAEPLIIQPIQRARPVLQLPVLRAR